MAKRHPPGTLASFHVPVKITWALVLGAAVLVVAYFYHFCPNDREEIKFYVSIVGGAAALYAAYFAGASLRSSAKISRVNTALGILKELNSIDMGKIRTLIDKELKNSQISPKTAYDKIMADDSLLSSLTTYLGILEDLSIAIQLGAADEEVLHRSLGFLVPWTLDGLRHYIEEERRRCLDPILYCELELLAKSWEARRYLSNNKTIQKLHA